MDNKLYIASLSYGKDSLAMIHVIRDVLDMPLDKIITADVWATDTIPADLPPMVEFKDKADRIIKERWGIDVEHVCAMSFRTPLNVGGYKCTYENIFYTEIKDKNGRWANNRARTEGSKCHNSNGKRWIYGFPCQRGDWCNSKLKVSILERAAKGNIPERVLQDTKTDTENVCGENRGVSVSGKRRVVQRCAKTTADNVFYSKIESEVVQYIGIASDEGQRTERHIEKMKQGKERLPLVEAGWTEQMCRDWCEENDLLSPVYTTASRGGCWFCHNQGVEQLRLLRRNYPEYWQLLLKWDSDSPVTFHADGHTVHDFDRRFRWEDEGYKPTGKMFRWSDIEEAQMNIYQFLSED